MPGVNEGHDDAVMLRSQNDRVPGQKPKEEPQVEKPAQKGPTLEERLNGITAAQKEQEIMSRLQADPDYRAVMDAKQRGQRIAVVPAEQLRSKSTQASSDGAGDEEAEPQWDSLSNTELVTRLTKRIQKTVTDSLSHGMQPFQGKLQEIEGAVQGQIADKVKTTIETARIKYPDFDEYKADMALLNRKAPGLELDELYALAKAKKGLTVTPPSARQTASEKPTSQANRASRDVNKPARLGNKGFKDMLSDALESRDFSVVADE